MQKYLVKHMTVLGGATIAMLEPLPLPMQKYLVKHMAGLGGATISMLKHSFPYLCAKRSEIHYVRRGNNS